MILAVIIGVIVLYLAYVFLLQDQPSGWGGVDRPILSRLIHESKQKAAGKRSAAEKRARCERDYPLDAEVVRRVLTIPLSQWTWTNDTQGYPYITFSAKTGKGAKVSLGRDYDSYEKTTWFTLWVADREIGLPGPWTSDIGELHGRLLAHRASVLQAKWQAEADQEKREQDLARARKAQQDRDYLDKV